MPEELDALNFDDDLSAFNPVETGEEIEKATVVFELHIRRPNFKKTIRSTEVVDGIRTTFAEADAKMLHVSQDLIERKALRDITQCDSKFLQWLKVRMIPSTMLAHGLYLVPLDLVEVIDVSFDQYLEQRETLIEELGAKYYDLKEQARVPRGRLFLDADYPPFDQVKLRFSVEARYLTLNVPKSLEGINKAIWEREQEKTKLYWADAAVEVRDGLRSGFAHLIAHFAERLGTDSETGKPRVFRETTVKNLQEFLDVFHHRDLTNDAELSELVSKAKALTQGVDVNTVRSDTAFRAGLEKSFTDIAKQAGEMIQVQERAFDFGEDNDAIIN